jgi:hypothetical protein
MDLKRYSADPYFATCFRHMNVIHKFGDACKLTHAPRSHGGYGGLHVFVYKFRCCCAVWCSFGPNPCDAGASPLSAVERDPLNYEHRSTVFQHVSHDNRDAQQLFLPTAPVPVVMICGSDIKATAPIRAFLTAPVKSDRQVCLV